MNEKQKKHIKNATVNLEESINLIGEAICNDFSKISRVALLGEAKQKILNSLQVLKNIESLEA